MTNTKPDALVELKSCPFCGHIPVHRQIPNDGRWITDCNTAGCIRPSTGICRSESVAITIWNTRTPTIDRDVIEEADVERVARAIADGLWGVGHADIYFDPRMADMPDVRRGQCENAARAAIRALKSPPANPSTGERHQWQPIETFAEPTALSSGCGVIVADEGGTVGEAYFRKFDDESDGWWWANTSWGDYPEPSRPTPVLWMPLPAPPTTADDEGEG